MAEHGQEWTDGYYNVIAIDKPDGSMVFIDAEGMEFTEADLDWTEFDEVDPWLSAEERIARWLATPGAPPLPLPDGR